MLAKVESISPTRPGDWVKLVRWMVASPESVVDYEVKADNAGKRRLRQTAALVASTLAYLPSILLILYVNSRPDIIDGLMNSFPFMFVLQPQWLTQNWMVIALLLTIIWIVTALLSPLLEPPNLSMRAKLILRVGAILIEGISLGWLIIFGLGPIAATLLLSGGILVAVTLGLVLGLTTSLAMLVSAEAGFLLMGQIIGLEYGLGMMMLVLPNASGLYPSSHIGNIGLFLAYAIPYFICLFVLTVGPVRRYGKARRGKTIVG